jgi:hypothetical protein
MPLGLKQFMNVDYRPGEDDLVKYRAHKRRREQGAGSNAEYSSTHAPEKKEELETEALSQATRLAKARAIRRNKAKLKMGRAKAARRMANKEVLMKRARRQARTFFAKKLTKGVPKGDLTPARKAEIEKRLDSPAFKTRIDRMAFKTLKDVRKAEMERKRK